MPQLFPYTFLPIHHSQVILLFDIL